MVTSETRPGLAVSPPEPFQGFNNLRMQLRVEVAQLQERNKTLILQSRGVTASPIPLPSGRGESAIDTAQLAQATVQQFAQNPTVFGIPIKTFPFTLLTPLANILPDFRPNIRTPEAIEQIVAQQQLLHDRTVDISVENTRINWRSHILEAIPWAVIGDGERPPLSTIQEVINQFVTPTDISETLTSEDIAFAADVLERSLRAQELNKVQPLTEQLRQDIIHQVTRNRSASVYGILAGGSANLLEVMIHLSQPGLPPNVADVDELRSIIFAAGFDDPEAAQKMAELESPLAAIRKSLIESTTRDAILHSDLASLELDKLEELLTENFITTLTSRPLMALLLPVDYWRRVLVQPLAGGLTLASSFQSTLPSLNLGSRFRPRGTGLDVLEDIVRLPEEDAIEFRRLFQQSRQDLNNFQALGFAFENSNMNGFRKFIYEVIVDPITYFGFGGYAKVLRALPKGVGVPLAGVEEGFIKGVDLAFLGLKRGIYNITPKTLPQIIKSETRVAFDSVRAYVEAHSLIKSSTIRRFGQVPLEEIKQGLRRAVNIAKNAPDDAGGAVEVGNILRQRILLTEKDVANLAKELGKDGPLPDDFLQGFKLVEINSQLGYLKGLGGVVNEVDGTTALLMDTMGVLDGIDGRAFQTMRSFVEGQVAKVELAAEELIEEATTVKGLYDSLFSHIDARVTAEHAQRAASSRMAALGGNWTYLDAISKITSANFFNRFNRGFARLYLMFGFYAPFNVLESGMKTAYAGLSPFYRGDRVRQLRDYSVGLTGLSEQFTGASGILLELGPVGEALASSRSKIIELSANAGGRRSRASRSAWTRYWGGLENALIGIGGRIGIQQQANYVMLAMQRALHKSHPEIFSRIGSLIDQNAGTLRASGMTEDMVTQILSEAENRVVVNAKSLTQLSMDFTPARITEAQVAKLIQKYPDMGPVATNYLLERSGRGELIPQLSNVMTEELPELLRQEIMYGPELGRMQFKKLLDELIASPPVTTDELRSRIQTLQFLGSDISTIIAAQTRTTQNYAKEILNLEVKGRVYAEMWDEVLIPFIREAEEGIQTYVSQLKNAVGDVGLGLTPEQQVSFNTLLDRNLERAALLRETWNQHRQLVQNRIAERNVLIAELRAAGQKTNTDNPRIQAWWNRFYQSREDFWGTAREAIARSDAGVLELGASLEGVALPAAQDLSGRILVAADVSRLFNSVPADLTRNLYIPELGVIQDKVTWVERIAERARVVAAQDGRVADDIGFSREAIRQVYDDILKEMTGLPEVVELIQPKLMQVQALRSDLANLAMRKNSLFTKEHQGALDRFGAGVLRDIEADDVARQVLAREQIVTPLSAEDILRDRQTYQSTLDSANVYDESLTRKLDELAEGMSPDQELRLIDDELQIAHNDRVRTIGLITKEIDPDAPLIRLPGAGGDIDVPARFRDLSDAEQFFDQTRRVFLAREEVQHWNRFIDFLRQRKETVATRRPGFSWIRERQKAMQVANDEFALNFPDYTAETAVNAVGRVAFPFWTYETHRLAWLPRSWIRTPGTLATQGKFQDYTDRGYVHIPGTSWEINPLRGTIWMGGMRGLMIRDFPEFYDRVPELANALDWMNRFGFYPNIAISGALAVAGGATGRSQLGEVIPGIIQTPLEAYVAAFPESESAKLLLETLMPNRFRDYNVSQAVSELGGPGVDILDKIYSDTPLDEEEEVWWAAGQRKISHFNLVNLQMGMLRFRPEEKNEFIRHAKIVIEECTGIPVSMQDQAQKTGQRLGEYIRTDPRCRELLQELEGSTRWRGQSSHLGASEVGRNLALQRVFWSEIEEETAATKSEREALDRQWQSGIINRTRYDSQRRDLQRQVSQRVESKRAEDRFQMELDGDKFPVPLTLQERQDFASAHGMPLVQMHAEDELIALFFGIELEEKYDIESGGLIPDWDGFFAQRNQAEQAIVGPRRVAIMNRIHKMDTDLDRVRRKDYDIYVRPYQKTFDFILKSYSKEEQRIIKRASFTDSVDERTALLAEERPDGANIVATFRAELTLFRSRLRVLDPELDARLAMWRGLSPKTEKGLELWRGLRKSYGFTGPDPVRDLIQEAEVVEPELVVDTTS